MAPLLVHARAKHTRPLHYLTRYESGTFLIGKLSLRAAGARANGALRLARLSLPAEKADFVSFSMELQRNILS